MHKNHRRQQTNNLDIYQKIHHLKKKTRGPKKTTTWTSPKQTHTAGRNASSLRPGDAFLEEIFLPPLFFRGPKKPEAQDCFDALSKTMEAASLGDGIEEMDGGVSLVSLPQKIQLVVVFLPEKLGVKIICQVSVFWERLGFIIRQVSFFVACHGFEVCWYFSWLFFLCDGLWTAAHAQYYYWYHHP